MSMRIHKLTTYLQAHEAYAVIEFIDQLRDILMQSYGDEIKAMQQQASAPLRSWQTLGDEEPF